MNPPFEKFTFSEVDHNKDILALITTVKAHFIGNYGTRYIVSMTYNWSTGEFFPDKLVVTGIH